jgi:uncharacterized membrane protein YgcG
MGKLQITPLLLGITVQMEAMTFLSRSQGLTRLGISVLGVGAVEVTMVVLRGIPLPEMVEKAVEEEVVKRMNQVGMVWVTQTALTPAESATSTQAGSGAALSGSGGGGSWGTPGGGGSGCVIFAISA